MSADTEFASAPTADAQLDAHRAGAVAGAYLEKFELDAALIADERWELEQLTQEALNLRLELLEAERHAAKLRKLYAEACARLIPFHVKQSQVAA